MASLTGLLLVFVAGERRLAGKPVTESNVSLCALAQVADMLGNLVAKTATWCHAEPVICVGHAHGPAADRRPHLHVSVLTVTTRRAAWS
jgi:hypothetical protein